MTENKSNVGNHSVLIRTVSLVLIICAVFYVQHRVIVNKKNKELKEIEENLPVWKKIYMEIGEDKYEMPLKLSEFIDSGWDSNFDINQEIGVGEIVFGISDDDRYILTNEKYPNIKLDIGIHNKGSTDKLVNCWVKKVTIYDDLPSEKLVTLPKGLSFDNTTDEFISVWGKPRKSTENMIVFSAVENPAYVPPSFEMKKPVKITNGITLYLENDQISSIRLTCD